MVIRFQEPSWLLAVEPEDVQSTSRRPSGAQRRRRRRKRVTQTTVNTPSPELIAGTTDITQLDDITPTTITSSTHHGRENSPNINQHQPSSQAIVDELQSRLEESFNERQELTDRIAALTSELDDLKTSNRAASGFSDDRNWANLRNALKDARRANQELRQVIAQRKPSFWDALSTKLQHLDASNIDSLATDITLMLDKRKLSNTLANTAVTIILRAISNPSKTDTYVLLCRGLMEHVAPSEHDEKVEDAHGNLLVGGASFRRHLVSYCQFRFELFLKNEGDPSGTRDSRDNTEDPSSILLSEAVDRLDREMYILGLARLLGELGKQLVLTERIIHACIKSLLENPKKNHLQFLYILLLTAGQHLDTPRAREHMDIFFDRIGWALENLDLDPSLQISLKELIQLRNRGWSAKSAKEASSSKSENDEELQPPGATENAAPGLYNAISRAVREVGSTLLLGLQRILFLLMWYFLIRLVWSYISRYSTLTSA